MKAWMSAGKLGSKLVEDLRRGGRLLGSDLLGGCGPASSRRSSRLRTDAWTSWRVFQTSRENSARKSCGLVLLPRALFELLAGLALLEGQASRRLPVDVGGPAADEKHHGRALGGLDLERTRVLRLLEAAQQLDEIAAVAQRLLELLAVGDAPQQVGHVEGQLVDRDRTALVP